MSLIHEIPQILPISDIPVADMKSFGIGELLGIVTETPKKVEEKVQVQAEEKIYISTITLLNRTAPTISEFGSSMGLGSATN